MKRKPRIAVSPRLPKIPPATILAMERYYVNRAAANAGIRKWNKMADLDAITRSVRKYVVWFEACAGTFWFSWKRPAVTTKHDQSNFRTGRILAGKNNWNRIRIGLNDLFSEPERKKSGK